MTYPQKASVTEIIPVSRLYVTPHPTLKIFVIPQPASTTVKPYLGPSNAELRVTYLREAYLLTTDLIS